MASGGYVSSQKSLAKVAREVGSRAEARRLITDALINGSIRARGSPPGGVVPCEAERLPIIGHEKYEGDGPTEDINVQFWEPLTEDDVKGWDWVKGYFCSLSCQGSVPAYVNVSFKEKDINSLRKLHRGKLRGNDPVPMPKERLRDASWHEWVAALATLAHEHQISSQMTQRELLEFIDARLRKWETAGKEPSTVSPTARVVLERFGSHPPRDPVQKH